MANSENTDKNTPDRPLNGHGTCTYPKSGDTYEGEFKNGMKHGQGTYTYRNAATYVGEFKNDMRNGQGTFEFFDGDKYEGEWKNDKRHGQGTWTYAMGHDELALRQYVGEWRDNTLWNGEVKDSEGNVMVKVEQGKHNQKDIAKEQLRVQERGLRQIEAVTKTYMKYMIARAKKYANVADSGSSH